jgi:hypothetical protein
MRKLIITLQAVGIVCLATLAIFDAVGNDWNHVTIDLLAAVLLGRL